MGSSSDAKSHVLNRSGLIIIEQKLFFLQSWRKRLHEIINFAEILVTMKI
jgi:hypothetical protein